MKKANPPNTNQSLKTAFFCTSYPQEEEKLTAINPSHTNGCKSYPQIKKIWYNIDIYARSLRSLSND